MPLNAWILSIRHWLVQLISWNKVKLRNTQTFSFPPLQCKNTSLVPWRLVNYRFERIECPLPHTTMTPVTLSGWTYSMPWSTIEQVLQKKTFRSPPITWQAHFLHSFAPRQKLGTRFVDWRQGCLEQEPSHHRHQSRRHARNKRLVTRQLAGLHACIDFSRRNICN